MHIFHFVRSATYTEYVSVEADDLEEAVELVEDYSPDDCEIEDYSPWEFNGEDNNEAEEVPQNNHAMPGKPVAQKPQLVIPLNP
jgi:hypothetical protein